MRHIHAKSIYPGRIKGNIAPYHRERFAADKKEKVDPREEFRQFKSALRGAQAQLASEKKMILDRRQKNPREIAALDDAINVLESHIMTLDDPFFLSEIKKVIFHGGASAAAALGAVIHRVSKQFVYAPTHRLSTETAQNKHFMQDLTDMKRRILFFLGMQQELKLPEGISIVAAEKLNVSEVLALKRAGVRGIVISETSETAHEVVMLRAMRIPCVTLKSAHLLKFKKPQPIFLDADLGYIVLKPRKKTHFVESEKQGEASALSKNVKMQSGEKFFLSSTLHFTSEILNRPVLGGAQTIGLYRTEYQISEAGEVPSGRHLQKQYEEIFANQPTVQIVFRLFDFSHDKNFVAHPMLESDSSLGGIRFLLKEKNLLERQLLALLRAAANSERKIKILLPRLSESRELSDFFAHLNSVYPHYPRHLVRWGGMLESVTAIFNAARWVKELDFFYVGTSDLLSSMTAQNRESPALLHRALLSDAFVHIAHELRALSRSRDVTLCGQAVGEPWAVFWLASLGLRNFTLPTGRMPIITNTIEALTMKTCRELSRELLAIRDEKERLAHAQQTALKILYGKE